MTTIGLIRHGLTDWNMEKRAQGQTDVPLNFDGQKQAEALANRLLKEDWNLIVTSQLSRAKATADTIGKSLEIPLIIDERLQEMSFGDIEGTTEAERVAQWGCAWKEIDYGPEPDEAVVKRSVECIEEMCKRYPKKKILFVSHGATLVRLMKGLLQDNTFDQGFKNTSLSIFNKKQDKWTCTLLNCAKHLEGKLV